MFFLYIGVALLLIASLFGWWIYGPDKESLYGMDIQEAEGVLAMPFVIAIAGLILVIIGLFRIFS